MAIASLVVRKGATAVAPTGGTDVTLTNTEPGKFVNLAAPLTAPEIATIQSTIVPPGKESSYVISYETWKDISTAAVGDYSNSKMRVYTVIRFDHEAYTDVEVADATRMHGLLLSTSTSFIQGILRGNK